MVGVLFFGDKYYSPLRFSMLYLVWVHFDFCQKYSSSSSLQKKIILFFLGQIHLPFNKTLTEP